MLLVRTDASRSDENYNRFRSPIGKLFLDIRGTKIAKGERKDKKNIVFDFVFAEPNPIFSKDSERRA